ncbi:hypothetical protein PQU95_04430 [Vogesella sp. DC21W]|uniref:Uncharacterized protein n=1 Tax=Vogesella aquatica TaxID=2984206 RepID=A0ABT5IVB8_9NEIS|nr:hypothetical protein [Vogesella aquatica]MDC7716462.1 hypothetical protein [Vogesella aquatica]
MNGITLQRRHGQVSVHWPRLAAEQLFVGRTPAEAIALAPQLFSLCGHAQQLAATLALAAASGQPAAANPQALAAVRLEAIRETLRRWLLDWAPACGQPCDASAIAVLARASTLQDYRQLAAYSIFGTEPAIWCQYGLAGWQQWAAAGDNAAARALQQLLAAAPEAPPALHMLGNTAALAAEPHWLAGHYPSWRSQPVETGALARYQPLLQAWLDTCHVSAARLLARWLALAAWLGEAEAGSDSCTLAGSGLALVDTARGPLLHLATLGSDGHISHYRVLPPTLWHSHPQGCMAQAAANGTAAQIQRRLLLIDPCVSFTLAGIDNEEPPHA